MGGGYGGKTKVQTKSVLTCTVPPLRVESSLRKKTYSSKSAKARFAKRSTEQDVLEQRQCRTTQQKRKQECSDRSATPQPLSDSARGPRDGARWRVVRR